MISIIMPAYNSEKTLVSSVQSVISQTYKEWELIIINDYSSDRTYEFANKFSKKNKRIKVINNKKRSGVSASRNAGIIKAKGNHIAFLDSDDLWMPNKLEQQLPYLKSDLFSVVFSWYYIRFSSAKIKLVFDAPKSIDYTQLLRKNFIGNLTAVYNTKFLGKIFQEKVGHEDYAYWLKILRESKMPAFCVQKPLATYRKSTNSLSANKIKCVKWIFHIYNKCEKLNTRRSILLLCRNLGYQALLKIG